MTDHEKSSFWYCNHCNRTLRHKELRYNCTICDDYDYCELCVATIDSPHPHPMVPELAYGPADKHRSRTKDVGLLIRVAMAMYRDRHCMGTRDVDENNPAIFKNTYSWLTFATIGDRAKNFGHGLRQIIEPRAYLAICADNRPEWMITDFACIFQGIISVPIYTLFTDAEMAHVLNNTGVSVVVCDKAMVVRFIELRRQCPSLRHIVCMDPIPVDTPNHLSIQCMEELERDGQTKPCTYVSTKPEDCLTVIYTSGSSALPKGVIVSHQTLRASFPSRCPASSSDYVHFSYRPLAWAADRDAILITLLHGGRVGFSTGDPSRLMEEIALVRPTDFAAAPAIWNKIYNEFQSTLALLTANSPPDKATQEEQRLLQHFAKLMPNRCKLITTGGASISPTVLNFMQRCFTHCSVNESYGITECGSVTYNDLIDNAVQYRLDSVPDMGYTTDDKPHPRGELLTKTPQMFSGYVNNPDETAAAITDDGFFRTGDIVELHVALKHIRVIDRKKNFFKLAQGQFVSPEHLQSIYLQSAFVEQIYIHGDLLSHCVTAVVVPNRPYAHAYAQQHHLDPLDTVHPHPLLRQAILGDLRRIAQHESLRKHEIPAHIIVDFEPFTPKNGLLTSSMKPCRHKLAAHYAHQLRAPPSTLEQQLAHLIETATGRPFISIDAPDHVLLSSGADSLSAVHLSRLIESDFGISLPTHVLFDPQLNLQRLSTLVQQPASHLSSLARSIVPQLLADANVELNITVAAHKCTSSPPLTVLITGTTGFVGAFLLSELLTAHPSTCQFVCLVRCDDAADSLDRIRQSMSFYQIWRDDYRKQIVALRGDLAERRFGLADDVYGSLAERVDVIYHCGAGVNFVLPYHRLFGSNVSGTHEIIRLATHHPRSCIPVHYISTMSVLGGGGAGEEISIDDTSPDGLVSGYAQSKWVAEKLISRASRCGARVVIYRLGLICADSRSGACNERDAHTLLFTQMMKTKCYPQSVVQCRFHGLPVDYTVRSIVQLSGGPELVSGTVYHVLKTSSVVALADVIDGMRRCGVEMESVSNDEWKMRMKEVNSPLSAVDELLLENAFEQAVVMTNEKFCGGVVSLECPALDQEYVQKWLTFILRNTSYR